MSGVRLARHYLPAMVKRDWRLVGLRYSREETSALCDESRDVHRDRRHHLRPRLAAALAPHPRARIPGAHVAVVKPVPDAGVAVRHHYTGRPAERAGEVC